MLFLPTSINLESPEKLGLNGTLSAIIVNNFNNFLQIYIKIPI
jgi:hypothetical protein